MSLFKTLFRTSTTAISTAEARTRLDSGQPVFLLDVRQPQEFKAGYIPGAKLIPLHELPARMNELPKDREILCICRSGARSGAAARQLQNAGFNALNVRGGMIAWQQAGYAIKKG